jgi:hypothetical protein
MVRPLGFSYETRKNGSVIIRRQGKKVAVLRGSAATRFTGRVGQEDEQELMARFTGNYKRGNERRQ